MNKNKYSKKYFQERDYLDPKIASAVKNFAVDNSLKAILDVGCGTGLLVKYLNSVGFESKGCDPHSVAKNSGNFIEGSATNLPFKNNSFDLVTSISVVEHLKKNEVVEFISEAKRVLKGGGYIFLVTPNYNSIWRIILGKKWFGYSDSTHINFYTPGSLSRVLAENGFRKMKFSFKIRDLGLVNYTLVSTPLWRIRDSFYISGQKK